MLLVTQNQSLGDLTKVLLLLVTHNQSLGDLTKELPSLHSSGGVTIWRGDDPVHLTDTAYGDIADHLVNMVKGSGGGDPEEVPQRRRLESIVTRSGSDPAQKPVPGWLLGGNQGGAKGRPPTGNIRGRAAGWRGGPGGRWAPY